MPLKYWLHYYLHIKSSTHLVQWRCRLDWTFESGSLTKFSLGTYIHHHTAISIPALLLAMVLGSCYSLDLYSVGKTSRRLLVARLVATNLTFARPELVVNFERLELVASNIRRRLLYAN